MLHDVKVQVRGAGQRLVRRHSLRVLERLQGRDHGVIDLARANLRDARRGQRRVVSEHAIRLRAVIAGRLVRLDGERGRDCEHQHQQDRDHGAASHPETSHRLKNPSYTRTGQQFVNSAGRFPDKSAARTGLHSEQERVGRGSKCRRPLGPTSPTRSAAGSGFGFVWG